MNKTCYLITDLDVYVMFHHHPHLTPPHPLKVILLPKFSSVMTPLFQNIISIGDADRLLRETLYKSSYHYNLPPCPSPPHTVPYHTDPNPQLLSLPLHPAHHITIIRLRYLCTHSISLYLFADYNIRHSLIKKTHNHISLITTQG